MIVNVTQVTPNNRIVVSKECEYSCCDKNANLFATAADICFENGIDAAMLWNYMYFVDADDSDYVGTAAMLHEIYPLNIGSFTFVSKMVDGEPCVVWHALFGSGGKVMMRGVLEGYNKGYEICFEFERAAC